MIGMWEFYFCTVNIYLLGAYRMENTKNIFIIYIKMSSININTYKKKNI